MYEFTLQWEKRTHSRLEARLLRGSTEGIVYDFDRHTIGPTVCCQRQDNFNKYVMFKFDPRRFFGMKAQSCDHFPGFKPLFRSFSEAIKQERSASHVVNARL